MSRSLLPMLLSENLSSTLKRLEFIHSTAQLLLQSKWLPHTYAGQRMLNRNRSMNQMQIQTPPYTIQLLLTTNQFFLIYDHVNREISENFFSARNIAVVKQRPKRKLISPFIAGSLLKKNNQDILISISKKTQNKSVPEKSKSKSVNINTSSKKPSNVNVVRKGPKLSSKTTDEPAVPSISGTSMRKGGL